MAKFLVLYRSDVTAREQIANLTEEHAKAGMDAWMVWAGKAGEAIVDHGAPLGDAGSIGPAAVTGGSGYITGFSVMQAESAEALRDIMDGHPHLGGHGSFQTFEFLSMPGM